MSAIVYLPKYSPKHCEILCAFAAGIPGARVRWLEEYKPHDEVAVVFGWYKTAYPPTMLKKPIIQNQEKVIIVESGFVRRGEYYQIGWGGFAGYADFKANSVSLDRWQWLGMQAQPWRQNEKGLVVVCGQLPRDTQVQDVDHIRWCKETFAECQRKFGKRAVFRPHPKADTPSIYGIDGKYIDARKLKYVLDDASFMVTWNSTTATEAAIAGVPVVAMERGSMAYEVAAHSIDEAPVFPRRRRWLAKLGYSMWNLDEMRAGKPWKHLTS